MPAIEFAKHDHVVHYPPPAQRLAGRWAHCCGCGVSVDSLLAAPGNVVLVREGVETIQFTQFDARSDAFGRA